MSLFYAIFGSILEEKKLGTCLEALKDHIHRKRMPVAEMEQMIRSAGFSIISSVQHEFTMRFHDAEAFFNHSLIKFWFLGSWKNLVPESSRDEIFGILENRLNSHADGEEILMRVPFLTFDCRRF